MFPLGRPKGSEMRAKIGPKSSPSPPGPPPGKTNNSRRGLPHTPLRGLPSPPRFLPEASFFRAVFPPTFCTVFDLILGAFWPPGPPQLPPWTLPATPRVPPGTSPGTPRDTRGPPGAPRGPPSAPKWSRRIILGAPVPMFGAVRVTFGSKIIENQ